MKTSIVKNIVKILLPFIEIFSIYVMLFGHLSPGGGFSGGSILASSLILRKFIYGKEEMNKKFPNIYLMRLVSFSLVMYGILKGFVFITAFYGLEGIPVGKIGTILSGGFIMPLNVLIGIVVAITFYFIASIFEDGEVENV